MKVASIAFLLGAVCSSTLQAELIGIQYGNTVNGNNLYSIDEMTGTGRSIASLPDLVFANSLAARDRKSLFSTVSDYSDSFKRKLIRIDPSSSVPQITVGPELYTSGTGYSTSIDALAYHPDYGMLGIELNDNLVRINLDTGRVDRIGQISRPNQPIGIQGLAFSPSGLLYGMGVVRYGLILINPIDASFVVIGGVPRPAIQALEFSPDGSVLYGAGEDLFAINVSTGIPIKIGSGAGFADVRGIAFAVGTPVPEPASVLLTAITLVALIHCRSP